MIIEANKIPYKNIESISADIKVYIVLILFFLFLSIIVLGIEYKSDKQNMESAYVAFIAINIFSLMISYMFYYGSRIKLTEDWFKYVKGWYTQEKIYFSSIHKWSVSNTYITTQGRARPALVLDIWLYNDYNIRINLKPYKINDRDKLLSLLPKIN